MFVNRVQTCGCQGEGLVGREGLGVWNRCKLVCIGWINHKVLLNSTENYIQYLVINHNGKEYEKEYIHVKLNHFALQ